MFNAPVTSQRYACFMRSLLQQLSRRRPYDSASDQMRRLIDLVVAGALLTLATPLMLLVALAIRVESPGPILVRENCVGLRGRRFQMLKFRTVPHDPDRSVPLGSGNQLRWVGSFDSHGLKRCHSSSMSSAAR